MSLRYVWEKWNTNSISVYSLSWREIELFDIYWNGVYTSYTFNKYTGEIDVSGSKTNINDDNYYGWARDYTSYEYTMFLHCIRNSEDIKIHYIANISKTYEYSKGSTSYGYISSRLTNTYPNNSYSGSYWYIYKGSDSIDPTAITYSPNPAKGGELVTITITPSTSIVYGGTISYKYEYQLDSGSWQVLNNSTSETSVSVVIPKGTTSFTARVTASDNMGFTSTPVVGDAITVNNNSNPVINFNNPTTDFGDVINNSQLSAVFYITDPDGDTLTLDSVKIKIDDKELTDFGQRYVSDGIYYCDLKVNESDFLQLPIGSHQLIIEANDGNGGKAIHTVSFNKVLYTTTLTLSEPMEADAIITKCTVSIVYNISTDADFEFLVTNNGFDENPTWEDMTNYIKNNWNYQFTNQTFTSNKYGFNFKLSVSRGESNIGGYIQSISGGFE